MGGTCQLPAVAAGKRHCWSMMASWAVKWIEPSCTRLVEPEQEGDQRRIVRIVYKHGVVNAFGHPTPLGSILSRE